ncbi:hypothetical protein BS78_08G030400 [Paspalum vaginatum]|nr:hypothetical protein BS78_08G030400 [Paspalum vaginatum]
MGRKGLASIFSRLVDPAPAAAAAPPWPWPPCGTAPQTASFRAGPGAGEPRCGGAAATTAAGGVYGTVNSVFLHDPAAAADDDLFSLYGSDYEDEEAGARRLRRGDGDGDSSFSTAAASDEWSEAVIRSLARASSTSRFFFDGPAGPLPGSSGSILEAKKKALEPDPPPGDDAGKRHGRPVAEGSVAVAVDSGDPYGDFRASMEEMVAAHGLRDWAALEALLACYLRINAKRHHHLIVGAFVDLLLGLSSSSSSSSSSAAETTTTTSSTSTSSGGACACACAGSRRGCTSTTTTSSSSTSTTAATSAAAASSCTPAAAAEAVDDKSGGASDAAPRASSSSAGAGAGASDDDDRARASSGGGTTAASAPLRRPAVPPPNLGELATECARALMINRAN